MGVAFAVEFVFRVFDAKFHQQGGSIHLRDGRTLENDDIVAVYVETLTKDEEARLFSYGCENPFGIEIWDFCDAIRTGRKPEMDAVDGLRSKALCETCFDPSEAGGIVNYGVVVSGAVNAFQKPINEHWGL